MSTNELWVLNDDSPNEVDDDGMQRQGFAICGVFSSPLRAIDHLKTDILGSQLINRFKWYRSPSNDGYILGYLYDEAKDCEYCYHIIRCEVDEHWPGTRPKVYPDFVALQDLPHMFDCEDALYYKGADFPASGNAPTSQPR